MKTFASLFLCVALFMGLSLPCSAAGMTYEEAVAELRGGSHYNSSSDWTYETDDCTVFVFDNGGGMRAPHNRIAIIYKAGSLPGEGVCLEQEYPYAPLLIRGPDRLELSEDRKTLTYAYLLEEDVEAVSLKAGIYTYTVDLPAGTTKSSYAPFSQDGVADVLSGSPYHTLESRLDGPFGSVILRWSNCVSPDEEGNSLQDYELVLVRGEEPFSQKLILPSTTLTDTAYVPTHLAPDSMTLTEDGKALTYIYTFDSPLVRHSGEVLHEAGTYTYTVDMTTGELSVSHTEGTVQPGREGGFSDVPAGSWFETGVAACAEKGVMVGTGGDAFSPERTLSQAECLTLAFRLYDLTRGQEHVIERDPEVEGRIVLTLADGTAFEGYGPGHGAENCVFRWWFSPMGTRQALYTTVPGWSDAVASGWSEENAKAGLKAQDAWLNSHPEVRGQDVPATITLNGVTYRGTTDCFMPVQPFVFKFDPEPEREEEVNSILYDAVHQKAAPAPWWQDTVYTIKKRGLEDLFDPAEFTSAPASRGFFARLMAVACEGHLEKINTVTAIPDLPREKDNTAADTYREAAYQLYEAGILTGVDRAGTFAAGNTLTRAEAAVMAARALDPCLRIRTAPQEPRVYDSVLSELRNRFGYHNERLFDTDLCTVVVNDYGGMMHAQKGCITLIYKPGSAKGDGAILNPPHPGNDYSPLLSRNPDSMELSTDKKSFTYSYHFDEPLEYEGQIIRAAGDFTYTVDLATGEVTERLPEVPKEVNTYETSLERVLAGYAEEGYVVEKTIEAPLCTLLFHYFPAENGTRSYFLELVYKTDVDVDVSGDVRHTPEGSVKTVGLPITGTDGSGQAGYPVYYTGRMPDAMSLSEDGNTFTLTYNECHYGSPYTQTIDLKTGMYDGE